MNMSNYLCADQDGTVRVFPVSPSRVAEFLKPEEYPSLHTGVDDYPSMWEREYDKHPELVRGKWGFPTDVEYYEEGHPLTPQECSAAFGFIPVWEQAPIMVLYSGPDAKYEIILNRVPAIVSPETAARVDAANKPDKGKIVNLETFLNFTRLEHKRVFISIPISGKEAEARETCAATVARLRECFPTCEFVTPFEVATEKDMPDSFYMGKDVAALMECDAMIQMPGWRDSKGCTVEDCVARVYRIRKYAIEDVLFNFNDIKNYKL